LAMQQRIWPDLLKQVDALWVSNVENIKEPGLSAAKWVPNLPGICSNALERVESSTEKTVLMVGSLGRPQMQQGFEWFIYEVWPEILKDCSYARLRVVGGGAPERLKAAWQSVPGVILEGFVDDIVPVYQSADLVVCPIFQGAGTSIKLIEALGFSCPVVTTLFGLRGYQDVLKAGEHVEVAETPADFAEVSVILLNDDARACRLGQSGAEAVAATFTYECLRQNIQRSVSETLESSQS
jgi:glycosyltransferase involved in cell wall biosynthesis